MMQLFTRDLGTKQLDLDWTNYNLFTQGNESFLITPSGEVSRMQGFIQLKAFYRNNTQSDVYRLFLDGSTPRIVELPIPQIFKDKGFVIERLWAVRYKPFYRQGTFNPLSVSVKIEEIYDVI